MICEECLKRDKRIRVLQSDFDFELRKTIEDKAEERALFEIGVQKEIRKWQDKYQKQKLDHEENGKKWIGKIDKQALDCENRIRDYQNECDQSMERQIKEVRSFCENQKEIMTRNHKKILKDIKEVHTSERQGLISSYKGQYSALENKFQTEMSRVKKQAEEMQQKTKKEFESILGNLRNEKAIEQKQNKKNQEQHRRERSHFLGEIYDLKAKLVKLQEDIKDLKNEIQVKNFQIQGKKTLINQIFKEHEQAISVEHQQRQKLKVQCQANLENQMRQFYEKELVITQRYEQSVKKIDEKRDYEQSLYRNNIQEIRSCIDSRQSKIEDLQEILILRQKLGKKEKDFEGLQRQVKYIQLQLQNKQDTYNKLFIPSVNSAHLNDCNSVKRKDLKLKRGNKHVSSTVRDILHAVNVNSSNLPLLNNIERKHQPPKISKIL